MNRRFLVAGLKRHIEWAAPIVIFYVLLGLFLILIALAVQGSGVSSDSYTLSTRNPLSVFVAPFVANLPDAESNAETFLFFLLVLFMAIWIDDRFGDRRRFRLAYCLIPVASGIVGAAFYLIPMHYSNLEHDGSGGSIIAASVNGMLIVLLLAGINDSVGSGRKVDAVFLGILASLMVLTFRLGFLGGGNASAHLYGFLTSLGVTSAYLLVARERGTGAWTERSARPSRVVLSIGKLTDCY